MSGKKAVFDSEQGHGDHLDSILDGIEIQDFLKTIPELLETAKSIGTTENEINARYGFTEKIINAHEPIKVIVAINISSGPW